MHVKALSIHYSQNKNYYSTIKAEPLLGTLSKEKKHACLSVTSHTLQVDTKMPFVFILIVSKIKTFSNTTKVQNTA